MLENLKRYTIVLGSNSPRRKELLSGLDIPFTVLTFPNIDESYPDHMNPEFVPEYIAKKKASAYMEIMEKDTLLITADTIVWTFHEILGKPQNYQEAFRMLEILSDKVHEVITGVCITTREKQVSFSVSAAVAFDKLTKEEIEYYLNKYKPYDKAGAYGIQEWIGYIGVEAINGSFFTVMGLPIQRVYKELKNF
ncbi:Maf-like protein [Parabacteroides pacaensis]|uniref:Maf-like protein n=1 Tax=Parabacteroides pacaensis TaxID=2086575 RepID=UPI000D0F2312|nr:Maf-like protein [Parabacteroides pacaensis]